LENSTGMVNLIMAKVIVCKGHHWETCECHI
jgi:hypothetical protein